MQGTQDRHLARLLQLVPLLLAGRVKRNELVGKLGDRLDAVGQLEALYRRADEDPIGVLDEDIRRIKASGLLHLGKGRAYEGVPGSATSLWVSPAEAQALRLAQAVLEQLGLPESGPIKALLGRVDPVLRGNQQALPTVSPSLRGLNPALWMDLLTGLDEGRKMEISYLKPNQEQAEKVKLDRARLMWMTGTFYLVAYVPGSVNREGGAAYGHLREYHLNRIEEVTLRKARVVMSHLPLLEGEAVLGPGVRGRVPSLWDAEGAWVQLAEELPDGRTHLSFRDPGLLRAQQRLWAFGPHLEAVLSPSTLALKLAPYLDLAAEIRANGGV